MYISACICASVYYSIVHTYVLVRVRVVASHTLSPSLYYKPCVVNKYSLYGGVKAATSVVSTGKQLTHSQNYQSKGCIFKLYECVCVSVCLSECMSMV